MQKCAQAAISSTRASRWFVRLQAARTLSLSVWARAESETSVRRQGQEAERAGKYGGGGGLRLVIGPNGAKRWVNRVTIAGKRIERGLGSDPEVPLNAARDAAEKVRKAVSLPLRNAPWLERHIFVTAAAGRLPLLLRPETRCAARKRATLSAGQHGASDESVAA